MNTRTSAFIALSLVAGLLTGCGRPVATALAPSAPTQATVRAAASTASNALPARLVIDDVLLTRSDRHERITIKAHSDAGKETLVFSSFFPYYIPMYGSVIRNGRTLKLDQSLAGPLDKLLHAADTTALSDEAQHNLRAALYGLDFRARHWNREQ